MSEIATLPMRIEFRRIQAISSRGNLRIRLTPEGDLFAYRETTDCPRGKHWSSPWPDRPVGRLAGSRLQDFAAMLADSGFFELPGEILTPGRDGFRDEIDAALGSRVHSVCVERAAAPPAFAHLRDVLIALAGPPFGG